MSPDDRDDRQTTDEQEGIQPKYRRSFGCVTWIYMATLAFLAAVSLLMMPFWFFGDWNVFSLLEGPALFATVLFLPAIFTAAILGARTYRSERKIATRNGTYVGAVIGWLGYTSVAWLEVAGQNALAIVFMPLAVIASALILYALFRGEQELGRRLVAASALLSLAGGAVVLSIDGDFIVVAGAVVSAISGAAAGWTGGVGYARAGGKEMLPPGVVEKKRDVGRNRD